MPTRKELEAELGKAWAAMAHREGHKSMLPSNSKPLGKHMDMDGKADTLLRAMKRRPQSSLKSLASEINTTVSDVNKRMMHLQRQGRVRLNNNTYEVIG